MADLSQTSFYGDGRLDSLKGPKGDKGDTGPQGPAGPQLPLPTYASNAAAKTAGLALGRMYADLAGVVRVVI